MKHNAWTRLRTALIGLACGAIPLVTAATCDPASATFDFFRDDDGYYDDGYIIEETIYYDDYYGDCYYDCY